MFWKHDLDFFTVGETWGYLKKEVKYDQERTETRTVFVTTLMQRVVSWNKRNELFRSNCYFQSSVPYPYPPWVRLPAQQAVKGLLKGMGM